MAVGIFLACGDDFQLRPDGPRGTRAWWNFCCRDGRSLVRRLAGPARRFLRASRVRLPSLRRRGEGWFCCRSVGEVPGNRCSWQRSLWIDPLWLAGNRLMKQRARGIQLRRRSRRISGLRFRARSEYVSRVPGIPDWRARAMLLRGRSTSGRRGNCSGWQSARLDDPGERG
jgi:hypothetical protein